MADLDQLTGPHELFVVVGFLFLRIVGNVASEKHLDKLVKRFKTFLFKHQV